MKVQILLSERATTSWVTDAPSDMCYVCVWATDGKDGGRERDALERMMGFVELEVMLCIV